MGLALLAAVNPGNSSPPNGNFASIGGMDLSSFGSSEADFQFTVDIAGTLSLLGGRATTTSGTGRAINSRIGTSNGAQSAVFADGSSGVFRDNINSDSIVSTNVIDMGFVQSGTQATYTWAAMAFQASSGHASFMAAVTSGTTFAQTATRYTPLSGATGVTPTEANVQLRVRASGTLQNLQMGVSANACTKTTTLAVRVNSATVTGVVNVATTATGVFQDTSHTDAISASGNSGSGDLINASIIQASGATGNITFSLVGATFISSGTNNDVGSCRSGGVARSASATANYCIPFGRVTFVGTTTETNAKFQHGFSVTTSNLRFYLSANTYTGNATAQMRNSGVNVNQVITVASATTGWFEDAVNTDAYGATDDMCFSFVNGTSGSVTCTALAITEAITEAVGVTNLMGQMIL